MQLNFSGSAAVAEASGPPAVPRWPDLAAAAALARRLGPLRWSQLGRRPAVPLPPADRDAVADWVVAAADRWWHDSGRPDPYTLVVVSADDGQLARQFLALGPECLSALRYVLVDPGCAEAGPPTGMAGRLALEDPALLYPVGPVPTGPDADPDEPPPPARHVGPLITWLPDLPVPGDDPASGRPGAGLIVAVGEAASRPGDRFEWDGRQWCELRLAAAEDGTDRLEEIRVPVPTDAGPRATAALPEAPGPGRYPVAVGARDWLRRIVGTGPFARLIVIDRWQPVTEPEPGPGPDAGPEPADDAAPGGVPLDQLRRVREPLAGPEPVAAGWDAVTWRTGGGA